MTAQLGKNAGSALGTGNGQQGQRHFAIVGAGVIGAAIAHYIGSHPKRNGALITVYEASSSVAPGASSHAGGFLAANSDLKNWHDRNTRSLAELSFRLHKELAEEHDGTSQWGYRPLHTFEGEADSTKIHNAAPAERLEWLNHGIFPRKPRRIGKPRNTAQVTPGALCAFLFQHAKTQLGVQVLLNRKVTGIRTTASGKVCSILVSEYGQRSRKTEVTDVIVCAGPWTGATVSQALLPGSPLHTLPFVRSAARVSGWRAHSILFRTAAETGDHALFISELSYRSQDETRAGTPEYYCRADGTVYGCASTDEEELPESVGDVDVDVGEIERLIEQTKIVFLPDVLGGDQIDLVRAAACFMPFSPESWTPIINFSAAHGFGVATGHTCWGITLSLGTGKVMSELIFDGMAASADISELNGERVPDADRKKAEKV
ncbi:hypothetical protein OC834_005473 [Tilletia horrida]|nr:hypothetical protein OC834_005473 [Tilletia horrida]